MRVAQWLVFLILSLLIAPAWALPPTQQHRVVAKARELLGLDYQLGGRLRPRDNGIDCQGLVFYALQSISSCGWKSWSVFPTKSVAKNELGRPLRPRPRVVPIPLVAEEHLEPADVVWLVGFEKNPAEPAIDELDGRDVWVWHVGLATERGQFIHADPYEGSVREVGLRDFLTTHSEDYAGIIVTRMSQGPKPIGACRAHSAMDIPKRTR